MLLETHVKLCVTEPDYSEEKFATQMIQNGPKCDFLK